MNWAVLTERRKGETGAIYYICRIVDNKVSCQSGLFGYLVTRKITEYD